LEDLGGLFKKATEQRNSDRSHQMAANAVDCSLFPVHETHNWELDEVILLN